MSIMSISMLKICLKEIKLGVIVYRNVCTYALLKILFSCQNEKNSPFFIILHCDVVCGHR